MRYIRNGTFLVLLAVMTGCNAVAPPVINVKTGMTSQQVRTTLGAPLITGTYRDTRGSTPLTQERWTYKEGDGARIIILENDKVTTSSHKVDPIPAMQKKIHEGMTRAEALAAIGQPVLGNNSRDPNPNPTWQYSDPVAPVSLLMVVFQGDKVVKIIASPNMAYGTR